MSHLIFAMSLHLRLVSQIRLRYIYEAGSAQRHLELRVEPRTAHSEVRVRSMSKRLTVHWATNRNALLPIIVCHTPPLKGFPLHLMNQMPLRHVYRGLAQFPRFDLRQKSSATRKTCFSFTWTRHVRWRWSPPRRLVIARNLIPRHCAHLQCCFSGGAIYSTSWGRVVSSGIDWRPGRPQWRFYKQVVLILAQVKLLHSLAIYLT